MALKSLYQSLFDTVRCKFPLGEVIWRLAIWILLGCVIIRAKSIDKQLTLLTFLVENQLNKHGLIFTVLYVPRFFHFSSLLSALFIY